MSQRNPPSPADKSPGGIRPPRSPFTPKQESHVDDRVSSKMKDLIRGMRKNIDPLKDHLEKHRNKLDRLHKDHKDEVDQRHTVQKDELYQKHQAHKDEVDQQHQAHKADMEAAMDEIKKKMEQYNFPQANTSRRVLATKIIRSADAIERDINENRQRNFQLKNEVNNINRNLSQMSSRRTPDQRLKDEISKINRKLSQMRRTPDLRIHSQMSRTRDNDDEIRMSQTINKVEKNQRRIKSNQFRLGLLMMVICFCFVMCFSIITFFLVELYVPNNNYTINNSTIHEIIRVAENTSEPMVTSNRPTPNAPTTDDYDDDGIPDNEEGVGPDIVDTDGDGTPDYKDIDADGDGLPDKDEGTKDTDNDGTPDYKDTDSNNDDTLDADADADKDGISNKDEGPFDTDKDGIPDSKDTDSD